MKKKNARRISNSAPLSHRQDIPSDPQQTGTLYDEPFIHVILLVILCFAIYANSMTVPFTFDDFPCVVDNTLVKGFRYFLDTSLVNELYLADDLRNNFFLRPVGYLSFAINHALHGNDVGGYHLFNILIHVCNSLLVYLLIYQMTGTFKQAPTPDGMSAPPSPTAFLPFFGAALFASHPIQTQAVTYVTQRFTSLATLFYLLTITLYVASRSSKNNLKKSSSYLGAIAAAILAMKTKEISFTLPVILVLYDHFFLKGNKWNRIIAMAPIVLTMLIIPISVLKLSHGPAVEQDASIENALDLVNFKNTSNLHYFITQLRVIVTYLRLMVLPINQNLDYKYKLITTFFNYQVILSALLISALLFVSIRLFLYSRRINCKDGWRMRMIAFGILWFFITLSVESSIIPIDDLIFEHRLYLPSIGMTISVVTMADMLRARFTERGKRMDRIVPAIMLLIVTVLSAAAVKRNMAWRNIWEDTARKSPGKARPFDNLGNVLFASGKIDEAIASYQKAIKISPGAVNPHLNLGNAYRQKKEYDKALSEYGYALNKMPNSHAVHGNLGDLYYDKGDFQKSVEEYRKSIAINPDYSPARNGLGTSLLQLGLTSEAEAEVRRALRINPDDRFARAMFDSLSRGAGKSEPTGRLLSGAGR